MDVFSNLKTWITDTLRSDSVRHVGYIYTSRMIAAFLRLGASVVASSLTPDAGPSDHDALLRRATIERAFSLTSPMELYTDSTATIIDPMRKTSRSFVQMGMMEQLSISRFSGPLSLGQSILVVLPYIISLIAITAVCFAISYTVFMRQEIRSL